MPPKLSARQQLFRRAVLDRDPIPYWPWKPSDIKPRRPKIRPVDMWLVKTLSRYGVRDHPKEIGPLEVKLTFTMEEYEVRYSEY